MLHFPKTPAQFRRQAEAGLRRENPDAEIAFDWKFGPKRCTYPTGLKGFTGHGTITAEGYGTRTFVASATPETGLSVRAGSTFLRDAAARILAARS